MNAPKKTETAITTLVEGSTITLTFSSGDVITVRADDLTPEMKHAAMMHGLKQKLNDAAAIPRNPDTGKSATITDKFNAVKIVAERITQENSWNAAARGEGTGTGGLLFRALCRLSPDTKPEAIREQIAAWSAKEQAAVRASSRVAPIIAELQAAMPKTGMDGNALLAGLLGE